MSGGPSHPLPDELARGLLDALSALGRAVAAPYDPHAFLREFSTAVQAFLPHDRMALFVFDSELESYTVFGEHVGPCAGVHDASLGPVPDPRRRTPIQAWARPYVRDARTIRIDDAEEEQRLVEDSSPERRLGELGFRSLLALPFTSDGRVVGSISLRSLRPHAFDAESERRLARLVDLAAPFFVCRITSERERWRRERLGRIEELARVLATHLDAREVFPLFAERLRPLLDYDHAGIGMLAANGIDILNYADTSAAPSDRFVRPEVPSLAYSFDARLRRGQPVVIGDASRDLDAGCAGDALLLARGLRSFLFAPVLFGERLGGAFFVGKSAAHWYDEADAEFAVAVATQISLVEQQQRLAREEQRRMQSELRKKSLEERLETLAGELHERWGFGRIHGRSRALRAAIADARKAAPTNTTVLLSGESGTGKELFARAIHAASGRASAPFVAINCGALTPSLLESELFGYGPGAFTGARAAGALGKLAAAHRGTLFLDEVAEMPPQLQALLLRFLEDGTYYRVGETQERRADVRVVAATCRDLPAQVAAGAFRSDLYYRIRGATVRLPALRERTDRVTLARALLERLTPRGKAAPTLSPSAQAFIASHPWPGNVRELRSALEHAIALADGDVLERHHLPDAHESGPRSLDETERVALLTALDGAGGNLSEAARVLGVARTTLYRMMQRHGLRR